METDGWSGEKRVSVPPSPSDYISSNHLDLLLQHHQSVEVSPGSADNRSSCPAPQATGLWLNPHFHFYWLRYGCGFVASPPHLLVFQLFHHRWKKLLAMISF